MANTTELEPCPTCGCDGTIEGKFRRVGHAPHEVERLREALGVALRALCLTRDYVGEDRLPAIDGWEWFDAGNKIVALIPDDDWTREFHVRVRRANEARV